MKFRSLGVFQLDQGRVFGKEMRGKYDKINCKKFLKK